MMFHLPLPAKANDCPPQNENPIINFSLNEDDTTCYTHHYLRAQESCYEQYFRGQGKEILLAEDGTVLADAHIAMVDSTWYMWLSVVQRISNVLIRQWIMWHHGLQLDSPTDQQAIKNGYHYNANVRK